MTDFLAKIISAKQHEVKALKSYLFDAPVYASKELSSTAGSKKLATQLAQPPLTVIAEIKRHSPANGHLAIIDDAVSLANQYVEGGATAISVLTERNYFQGCAKDLMRVKAAIDPDIPVLRKDFIIDPVQLLESLFIGADVVLLIAAILQKKLAEFIETAKLLNLEAIVEVHTDEELDLAIESGAEIIGINNRNLTSFAVSLDVAFTLIQRLPKHIFAIAESGILQAAQAILYHQAGFSGVLIGQALVQESKPALFIQHCLLGVTCK